MNQKGPRALSLTITETNCNNSLITRSYDVIIVIVANIMVLHANHVCSNFQLYCDALVVGVQFTLLGSKWSDKLSMFFQTITASYIGLFIAKVETWVHLRQNNSQNGVAKHHVRQMEPSSIIFSFQIKTKSKRFTNNKEVESAYFQEVNNSHCKQDIKAIEHRW
uniref:Uncharacterized protein n=1 Tax=Glossina morsitans morsitans TaxID=37546 RepID=A0A1B0G004_GLOMM